MTAVRRETRNVRIDVFVAVLGNVRTVQSVEIGEHGEQKTESVPEPEAAAPPRFLLAGRHWAGGSRSQGTLWILRASDHLH